MARSRLPITLQSIPGISEQSRFEVLRGGLSNNSWRVLINGKSYAARQGSQTNRAIIREAELWARAAAQGLAPALYHHDPDNGLIVSEWAEGETGSADSFSSERLAKVGRALALLHDSDYPDETLDLVEWSHAYCQRVDKSKLAVANKFQLELQERIEGLGSIARCLCHNDLVAENMIFGSRLVFVDWEYAMANDPFFDLAVVCAHHRLSAGDVSLLLENYCGRLDTQMRERLFEWQQLYLRLYALWLLATPQVQGAEELANLQTRLR